MGVVVAMTPRATARPAARTQGSAEILFFTGVRYYRMTDDFPAAPAPAPEGKTRAARRSSRASTGSGQGPRRARPASR